MEKLKNHIAHLKSVFTEKGYDGYFLSGSCYPGCLSESVTQFVDECLKKGQGIKSFYLTTYACWKDESNPYIQCNFKIVYDSERGFNVVKLKIKHGDFHSALKTVDLDIETESKLPERVTVIQMIQQCK